MPTLMDDSARQLQIEGAVFAGSSCADGLVCLYLEEADVHHEDVLERYQARLFLLDGYIDCSASGVGSVITEASIVLPGVASYHVFVPLPFALSGTCRVELCLGSGERFIAQGASCSIQLGASTRHPYHCEASDSS